MEPHRRWLQQRDEAHRIYALLKSLGIDVRLTSKASKPSASGLKLMCAIARFAFQDDKATPDAMRKRLG
jgi:hypothetical protein